MPELSPLDPHDLDAPLRGVNVLELDGEFTGYAGRLLADLGAHVTRLQLSEPIDSTGVDAEAWFLHRDKTEVMLDASSHEGREQLAQMIGAADILLQSGGADARPISSELAADSVRACNGRVIHAILTPFGLDGPAAEYASTDLIRLAAGGLLWLGGYPDAEPTAPFGDQSTIATAIFGVVAALLALIERDSTGKGRTIDVSSQEVVTQALETSIPEYELTGKIRRRLGDVPREAGTGVYPCADGFVSMVAGRLGTAGAWKRLLEWLAETGTPGAEELTGEGWNELSFRQRPEAIARFSEIFGAFATSRSKEELYLEAQLRSIALAPVNNLDDVLRDHQLRARGFFREAVDPVTGTRSVLPAAPYRLSEPTDAPEQIPAVSATAAVP